MNPFLWAMTVAGGLTALVTIARLSISITRLVARLDQAMPVLLDIASTFRDPTLLERIEAVERNVQAARDEVGELHGYSHEWRHKLTNDMQKVLLKLNLMEGDL